MKPDTEQNFSVMVTGFKTKQQAETFASWYCGQGEQDIWIWLDAADIGVRSMNTDVSKKREWVENVLEMPIKVREVGAS